MAPMPLRQLLESANKGVLFSSTFSKDQDDGLIIPSSISQNDIRSNTLSDARKTIHALVMKSAHRTLVDGAIADFLHDWMKAPKNLQILPEIPARDCPPGFVHQQQDLRISSPSPDMPPGFAVVSVLCMLIFSDLLVSSIQDLSHHALGKSCFCTRVSSLVSVSLIAGS